MHRTASKIWNYGSTSAGKKKLHIAASHRSHGDSEPSAQCVCQLRIEQDQDYYVLL